MLQKNTLIVFALFFFAPLLAAENGKKGMDTKGVKEYVHRKDRFSFFYPETWTIDTTKKDVSVVVVDSKRNAAVSVHTQYPISGKKACQLLQDFEKTNPSINFNLIPEAQQHATADELRFVHATDSCIGVYKYVAKNTELLQGVVVYIRGAKAWFVTQLLVAPPQSQYLDIVGSIAKSFRLQ
ncbi:MAG TPA: hypothetical protein PLY93_00860 [Turneriella sp.]|nr:hypothetical protein [Turneriella sp.]